MIQQIIAPLVIAILLIFPSTRLEAADLEAGLVLNEPAAFGGYTLFAPIGSTTTYLIDMEGRIVNQWESEFRPGHSAYLLEDGHLLRAGAVGGRNRNFHGGGAGGRIQEFSWEGELLWDYEYSGPCYLQHHDFERLPNGNILLIAWEARRRDEAVAAGRNPDTVASEGLWADHIGEVKPTGRTTGEIVWEWHVWDHLVQEYDPEQANHGVVADHPELINVNPLDWIADLAPKERRKLEALGYLGAPSQRGKRGANPDWNHINSIAYNAALDQIVLSVLNFSEIWIIDHSTTTEEAAGHKGGRSRKGGDLLYRWGNSSSYHRGTAEDQQLFAQHDAHWIPDGLNGAGRILIFNNGRGRLDGNYSSVDEIALPVDETGRYRRNAKSAFGPDSAAWSYTGTPKRDFYSGHISGAQRLPNGNTLICSGETGSFIEVTEKKQVVWRYVNPVRSVERPRPGRSGPGARPPDGKRSPVGRRQLPARPAGRGGSARGQPGGRPEHGPQNNVFRAYRYGPDYAGLAGKDLTPGATVEETLPPDRSTAHPNDAAAGRGEFLQEVPEENLGFVIEDPKEFARIVPAEGRIKKLAGDMKFIEGPVWVPDGGYLLFSDIPADEIKKWHEGALSVFRKPSRNANGNLLDGKGRLLTCEHGSRTVTRTAKDGAIETLIEKYGGKKFNSPNDLAVRSDGTIWFTDPPYGLKRRAKEQRGNNVFCFHPATGQVEIVVGDFDKPNGICLSPDETRIYIADSGQPRHIRVFEVSADGTLSEGKIFCTIDRGAPDGIRCDEAGRVFASSADGVQIFSPRGKLIGKILVDEVPANLCFGGADGKTLFITARTSLYCIELKVAGVAHRGDRGGGKKE